METISDSRGIRCSVESLIGGRSENQDSYGMAETTLGMLVVVCDGMGGGPGGKTASSIATQAIIDYVAGASQETSPLSVLEDAAAAANEEVLAAVEQNQALRGMGTTCVCLLIQKNEAFIMHVGDSRCYQLRGDKVVFRTADHSYVGELVRRGSMTEEAARVSKYSNVITKAIGAGVEIAPEVDTVPVKPGDRFALMTDGIWGSMPESQLLEFIEFNADPATLVPQIATRVDGIGMAGGGGHDNLTLAIVDLPGRKNNATKTLNEVLGERLSENRAPAESLQAKPTASFSLEETPASQESKTIPSPPASKKSSVIIYVLVAALIAALALSAWFFFFSGKDRKSGEDIVKTTLSTVQSEQNNQKDLSERENQTDQAGQSNVPNDMVISSACNSVTRILAGLKDYKPVKDKSVTKKSVEQKRLAMITSAADSLQILAAALQASDPVKAEKIKEIEKKLREDAAKMKKVDAKFFHSREDSNTAIDINIAAVKTIVNL